MDTKPHLPDNDGDQVQLGPWHGNAGSRRWSRRPAPEQPRREFAPAGPTTRAKVAGLQVARIGPALCQHARRSLQHVQPATPPRFPPHTSPVQGGGSASVAERDRRGITARIDRTNHVPAPISMTTPLQGMSNPRIFRYFKTSPECVSARGPGPYRRRGPGRVPWIGVGAGRR